MGNLEFLPIEEDMIVENFVILKRNEEFDKEVV